jgi:hypothetical protein
MEYKGKRDSGGLGRTSDDGYTVKNGKMCLVLDKVQFRGSLNTAMNLDAITAGNILHI